MPVARSDSSIASCSAALPILAPQKRPVGWPPVTGNSNIWPRNPSGTQLRSCRLSAAVNCMPGESAGVPQAVNKAQVQVKARGRNQAIWHASK